MDVALQRTVYTATEGESKIEICAVVNASTIGFDFNISIAFKSDSDDENPFPGVCSGTLKAHNSICSIFSTDLYFMSDILSFFPFEKVSCTLLFVKDDSIAEGMEVLNISLKRPADLDRRIRVDSTPARVLIVDNDGSSISAFSSFYHFLCVFSIS